MLKTYADLTKFGIVIFVLLSGIAGYASSFAIEKAFSLPHLAFLVLGLYCLSSGSLALNQLQERHVDVKMPRTQKRPLVLGSLSVKSVAIIVVVLLVLGLLFLYLASVAAFLLGLLTVLLYNFVYVYFWKPKMAYAAVPGAIPGALPVSIGYAANSSNLLAPDSIYLFLIMFLWQMPHFWVLAVKYKEDYALGGIPVLPVEKGLGPTFFQIGLYTFCYVFVATASPWFVQASWIYIALVVPFSFFVLKELFVYIKSEGKKWFKFFMWLNLSMLVYLVVPVIDKWNFLFIKSN